VLGIELALRNPVWSKSTTETSVPKSDSDSDDNDDDDGASSDCGSSKRTRGCEDDAVVGEGDKTAANAHDAAQNKSALARFLDTYFQIQTSPSHGVGSNDAPGQDDSGSGTDNATQLSQSVELPFQKVEQHRGYIESELLSQYRYIIAQDDLPPRVRRQLGVLILARLFVGLLISDVLNCCCLGPRVLARISHAISSPVYTWDEWRVSLSRLRCCWRALVYE